MAAEKMDDDRLKALLSQEIAEQMATALDGDAELAVVPSVGHAPNLEEPEAIAAMDRLLERVMAREEEEAA